MKYLKKNFKSANSESLAVKVSPVASDLPLAEVAAEITVSYPDLKDQKVS